jgi:CubicO group peptidase (beta-lactamase class C family)
MIAFLIKIFILLVVVSCSNQNDIKEINGRIEYVENNLIEFVSPAGMLNPDSSQLANPKTLHDRMAHYNTPGVSIAVINNYELEWAKGYGTMDNNTVGPVTTETIFEAASTSKFVTAVLVLNFVQKGLIDLDKDVNDYLKSWQIPENDFTQVEKVTIRRLLTHKAGLPTTNFSHDDKFGYPTLLNVLNGVSPALNAPAVPELIPGSQWQYSNVAYDVIQLIIEDISGKSFQQNAEDILFIPLGMNQSTFNYPLNSEMKIFEAMPHDAEGNSLEPSMHLTALAHGGLLTTPTDLAKFTNEIMLSYKGKSEKILSQELAKKLFNNEFDLDPRMFGMPISEGLGVLLIEDNNDLVFAHPGSNLPGLNCWLVGWLEQETAIIVMTNGAMGEVLAMEIISAFNYKYNNTI